MIFTRYLRRVYAVDMRTGEYGPDNETHDLSYWDTLSTLSIGETRVEVHYAQKVVTCCPVCLQNSTAYSGLMEDHKKGTVKCTGSGSSLAVKRHSEWKSR